MEFNDVINNRESCRDYSAQPVEKEKLEAMIAAARISPSACDSQPWHYTVVTEPSARQNVAKCLQKGGMNKFTDGCPAFIVVCERAARLKEGVAAVIASQTFAQIDIGLSVAHLCLKATDLGLSTCIVGWIDKKKLGECIGQTDSDSIRVVVCVGYAAKPGLRVKKRKDIGEISSFIE